MNNLIAHILNTITLSLLLGICILREYFLMSIITSVFLLISFLATSSIIIAKASGKK